MGNILIVVSSNTMLCKIYIFCFADFNIRVGWGFFAVSFPTLLPNQASFTVSLG